MSAGFLGIAALLSGCAATDGLMNSVQMSATSTAPKAQGSPDASLENAPAGGQPSASDLVLTGQERAYLDALAQSGIHPSSELLALSIGSYVCQAQAAGQSKQAVWDFIYPLVHRDVRDTHPSAGDPPASEVDAATQSYIRIATERLC